MNTRLLLLVFFFILLGKQEASSQYNTTHEVGITMGVLAFYSDFGERRDFETNTKNVGFGVGIVHYLNFTLRSERYFDNHFKVRNELIYHKTDFEHYGRWVAPEKTSTMAKQLRAMKGSSTVIEVGTNLEFFPRSIYDFENNGFKITPYASLGLHYVHFDPKVTSTLGKLNGRSSTPIKYLNSFRQEPATTLGLVGSVGVRYKLNKMNDLVFDTRWTYYFSDYVDGLNPSLENNGSVPVPENKSNDWVFWLNIGYIHYLD